MARWFHEYVRRLHRDVDRGHQGHAQPRTAAEYEDGEEDGVDQQAVREGADVRSERPTAVVEPQDVVGVVQHAEARGGEDQLLAAPPPHRGCRRLGAPLSWQHELAAAHCFLRPRNASAITTRAATVSTWPATASRVTSTAGCQVTFPALSTTHAPAGRATKPNPPLP